MNWMKRSFAAGGVVMLTSLALVVSAPAASAWAPPAPAVPAPPRITAPPTTLLKPMTTGMLPKTVMGRVPGLGLAIALNDFIVPWLESVTGNSATPSLGCVTGDGKFIKAATSCDAAASEKPQTAGPDGLAMPDLLWNALTGKNLNPLLLGPAPANWSVSQATPTIGAPANGLPGWVSISYTGVRGQLCTDHPTWNSCPQPEGWKGDISSWGNSQAKFRVQCLVSSNGGKLGAWNGSGNNSTSAPGGLGNLQAAAKDYQVCRADGSQIVNYVKQDAGNAPYEFAPSWAPGIWMNPNIELYKDMTVTTNLTCKNGAGQTSVVSMTSTGTGVARQPICPAGYLPDSGNTTIGSAFLEAPTKVEEWAIAPATRDTYAECIGWQAAGCIMRVELDGVDCSPANPACFDWAEIQRLQPSRIKCKWGNYTIDISNCMPLRNGYQSESGVAPMTGQNPGAAPIARDFFGRPLQPNADPLAPPNWQPDYGTPGNPAPAPSGGANPAPAPIPQLPTNPNPNPTPVPTTPNSSDSACWPSGSAAFNPLEWVLQPVKCALSWAFVPKRDFQSDVNGLTTKAMTKAPLSFVPAITATAPASVGGQGACPAWVVSIGTNTGGQNSQLNKNIVCDSTFIQAIVNARSALFGLITAAMLWPFLRSLWYALIPVVRVIPTGGR